MSLNCFKYAVVVVEAVAAAVVVKVVVIVYEVECTLFCFKHSVFSSNSSTSDVRVGSCSW